MGLPALAARALRVLGEGEACKEEEHQLQNLADPQNGPFATVRASVSGRANGEEEQQWQLAAVPHLAKLLKAVDESRKGSSGQGLSALPRQGSLSAGQRQSERLFFLRFVHIPCI